jgi:hypothetical protein
MANRDDVPRSIKRQLRREAGFGCCVCGMPFVQYHHIVPYSSEAHNRPEDMMALCPTCHAMATAGALTETEQRQHKARPRNVERGFADGLLKLNQEECVVAVGDTRLGGNVELLRVDDEPLLALYLGQDKQLLLSATVYGPDDGLLLRIDRNEWVTGDAAPWDIDYRFRYLALRRADRDISLEFDARHDPIRLRASLWRHGHNIKLWPGGPHGLTVDGDGWRFFMAAGFTMHNMCINVDTMRGKADLRLGVMTGP